MAAVPTIQNLDIYRGDDETITLTFKDKVTGLPKNLTGSSFFFTAKINSSDLDSAAVIARKVTGYSDPTSSGIAMVALTHTDTAVGLGTYVYDLQWVDVAGNVKTVLKGKLTVHDDVTKATS
jgi:hypothetical protein